MDETTIKQQGEEFTTIAGAMGFETLSAERPRRIRDRTASALANDGPTLVEIPTDPAEPQAIIWLSESSRRGTRKNRFACLGRRPHPSETGDICGGVPCAGHATGPKVVVGSREARERTKENGSLIGNRRERKSS